MTSLDDISRIRKLDKSNVLGSIRQLYLQCQQTFEELQKVTVPASYKNIDKIVINGMGGSRLGARVAERLFSDELRVPLIPLGSYTLPGFVNDKTLLILSSYSGNTEEIVTSYNEAVRKKAKIMILSQNGKLAEIARKNKLPGYFGFEAKHNPCGQPRMSLGYQVLGIILLLSKCGLLQISQKDIKNLTAHLNKVKARYYPKISSKENLAKKLARNIHEKIPVLAGAEFLMGSLHVFRNQINENAKNLALYFEIPELNHHLLEGLRFPKTNPKSLFFIFFKTDLYYSRNQKRIEITKKVLDGYKIKHLDIRLNGKNKLEQAFEVIQFGSFVSFYLSILNNLDPTPIPWVDYFKKELSKL